MQNANRQGTSHGDSQFAAGWIIGWERNQHTRLLDLNQINYSVKMFIYIYIYIYTCLPIYIRSSVQGQTCTIFTFHQMIQPIHQHHNSKMQNMKHKQLVCSGPQTLTSSLKTKSKQCREYSQYNMRQLFGFSFKLECKPVNYNYNSRLQGSLVKYGSYFHPYSSLMA